LYIQTKSSKKLSCRLSIWSSISLIGVKNLDRSQVVKQKKLNNQVCLFTSIATFFFIPYLYAIGNYYYVPFELATVLLILLSFLFNYFGYFSFSMFWRFIVILADVSFASLEMPGAGFEYFLIPLGLIPFILSNVKAVQLSLLGATIFFFFLRMFESMQYTPHSIISSQQATITYIVVLSMVFLLCGLFINKYNKAIKHYELGKKEQLKIIAQKNKDILDSIHYAKRIQDSLLPTSKYIGRVLKDLEKKERQKSGT
jgi:phosphoserine phosphatase RsbU/P